MYVKSHIWVLSYSNSKPKFFYFGTQNGLANVEGMGMFGAKVEPFCDSA